MRVYISGPITGTEDFVLRFAVAEKQLQIQGYDVFNPARVNQGMPKVSTWEDYMKVAEAMLSCCDTIYMLRGWENSRGAVKEYHLAMAAGMVVLKESDERFFDDESEQSKEIKVNDIVKVTGESGQGIVTAVCSGLAYILWKDGGCGDYELSELERTGRKAEGLADLLRQIAE